MFKMLLQRCGSKNENVVREAEADCYAVEASSAKALRDSHATRRCAIGGCAFWWRRAASGLSCSVAHGLWL